MKRIILIILCSVFISSCKNVDSDKVDQRKKDKQNVEEKIKNSFVPVDSPITEMLHTHGWKKAYSFYVNEINNYKHEDYYQVGKLSLMGKVLINTEFKNNPDQDVLKKFLTDIFRESLPAPAMIVKIINIYEENPQMPIKDLERILGSNIKILKEMNSNLDNIRESGYNSQMENSNLKVPGFKEKVSKYAKLN